MLHGAGHSAILSSYIKLPFVIKIFVFVYFRVAAFTVVANGHGRALTICILETPKRELFVEIVKTPR